MSHGIFSVPPPANEPVRSYGPGSPHRASLQAEVERQYGEVVEIPCVVGGERVFTGNIAEVTMPTEHGHVLAKVHLAGQAEVERAVEAAEYARKGWSELPWEQRAAWMLRCATLLAGPWRDRLNASTMLGQGKIPHQAEIDAACELIDFWRFNPLYANQIYAEQPPLSSAGVWNRSEHRCLDGFVFAVTPFNFTSIALNLPTAPALMGNTAIWKPSLTQSLSAWYGFELLEAAGMMPGVINLLHGHGADVGAPTMARRELAGIHFTGSTPTFQHMWKTVGENVANYVSYPRMVGETGGKDFIVVHPSADAAQVATAILRGAFEFNGQKCSAASRVYLPRSLAGEVHDRVVAGMAEMKQGCVRDFSSFITAVIDERAFAKHQGYLQLAHETGNVLAGGQAHGEQGWFVEPTLVSVDDPGHRLLREEIFGPIVTSYTYDGAKFDELLPVVDKTADYALTGSIFAEDRDAIQRAVDGLRFAAGNFYINDKPTGAVVGQQPFGGSRASGTNDKAGSKANLSRWISSRSIKETFDPPRSWKYDWVE